MCRGVKASGLEKEWNENGPFTVFAPSEIAFGKLPAGELANLLKPENKVKLTDILNNHIIAGKINFKDFVNGQKLKSLAGHELDVKIINSIVTINGATVQGRDFEASNGVVFSLDRLIAGN